jgi:nickel-dependent lactate racemase
MSAAALVVKPGGTIIAAADCWDGVPDHGNYSRLLQAVKTPADLLTMARTPSEQCQDMWQVHCQALVSAKADVYVYSHNLTPSQIEAAHLKPCNDIDALIQTLVSRYGPDVSICVLPEGPQTIPYLAKMAQATT